MNDENEKKKISKTIRHPLYKDIYWGFEKKKKEKS